jgi:hypothetical protein
LVLMHYNTKIRIRRLDNSFKTLEMKYDNLGVD